MIKVTYREQHFQLNMEGHACSGEPGRDLVCSAASVLAYTLANNVAGLEADGKVRGMTLELNNGSAEIRCTPCARYREVVKLIYCTIIQGFEMLARDYPEFVEFTYLQ